jgi:AcrR family transcriptional regulator
VVAEWVHDPAKQPAVDLGHRVDLASACRQRPLDGCRRIVDDEQQPCGRALKGLRAEVPVLRRLVLHPEPGRADLELRHHLGELVGPAEAEARLGPERSFVERHGLAPMADRQLDLDTRHYRGITSRYHGCGDLLGAGMIRYGNSLVNTRASSTPAAPQSGRRPYRSPLRQAKARRTRARILEAATQLFRTHGYAGTTVAAVAAAAQVSVAAVELAFPTKPDLLKAAIDVAIAGDDEPVPVLERPWAASARAAPGATAFLDAVATILVPAAERSDGLVLAALEGARSDDRLVPLAAQLSAQRAVTAGWIVDGLTEKTPLRAGLGRSEAIDIVWLLMDPAVFDRLTTARSWPPGRFGRFFADGLLRLLTEPVPAGQAEEDQRAGLPRPPARSAPRSSSGRATSRRGRPGGQGT